MNLSYVLITPARDEEEHIEKTFESIVSQTIPPLKWVIVSDASTDGTDRIAGRYAERYAWIDLVRKTGQVERNFASKVYCFDSGYERVKDMDYDIIGCLDADISFEPDYFEFLLKKFAATAELGVSGTPFVESGRHYDYNFTNIEHVSGACQLFRKKCFEEIGGYTPIKGGGIDWLAVTTARMKGWRTRTFTEKVCVHHRKMGSASGNSLAAWYRRGREDYILGGHPVWELSRVAYQVKSRPFLLAAVCLLSGYAWAAIRRVKRPVSKELLRFHRAEQMRRLSKVLSRNLNRQKEGEFAEKW